MNSSDLSIVEFYVDLEGVDSDETLPPSDAFWQCLHDEAWLYTRDQRLAFAEEAMLRG